MRTDWVLVGRKKKSKGVGKSLEGEKNLSSNSLNASARSEELQRARAPLQRATGGATAPLAGQRGLRGVSALYTKVQWFSKVGGDAEWSLLEIAEVPCKKEIDKSEPEAVL